MRQRGTLILLGLGLLLLVGAYLLAQCGEERLSTTGPTEAVPTRKVEYPRQRQQRESRLQRAGKPTKPPPTPAEKATRDRLLRALSSPGGKGAVVMEVNALRHSPLVDALLTCREQQGGDEARGLALMKEELGIDIREDVDRIAIDAEVLAVSGFFKDLKLPPELGDGDDYGDNAHLFEMAGADGDTAYIARVGEDLVLTGTDQAQIKAAIDRAEGRAEAGPSFQEGTVGGEVYGTVGKEMLLGLMAGSNDPRLAVAAEILTTSQVRMTVDTDAALSLDLGTRTDEEASELAKVLGGVVAVARNEALSAGNSQLAGLLEQARATPDGNGVAFDVAIPGNDLLRAMGCPPLAMGGDGAPAPTAEDGP